MARVIHQLTAVVNRMATPCENDPKQEAKLQEGDGHLHLVAVFYNTCQCTSTPATMEYTWVNGLHGQHNRTMQGWPGSPIMAHCQQSAVTGNKKCPNFVHYMFHGCWEDWSFQDPDPELPDQLRAVELGLSKCGFCIKSSLASSNSTIRGYLQAVKQCNV